MKQLILMRHSVAENGSFSISDKNRKLTEQGIYIASQQVKKLQQFGFVPDGIVTSDASRARQTAQIILDHYSLDDLSMVPWLYEDFTTSEFVNFITQLPVAWDTTIIVGHNPTISNVAYRLAKSLNLSFSPATMVVIDFDCLQWTEVSVQSGTVAKIILP